MPRSVLVPLAALLTVPLLVVGCGSDSGSSGASSSGGAPEDGRLTVVASTNVWGDVAAAVGGDAVEVTSFIDDPSQDPHSFEADARNQLAVSDADVVVENGGGYDDFMDTLLKGADGDPAVINAVEESGKEAADGEELNEHVWYDVPTVAVVATSIAQALGKADPDQADTFTANAEALGSKLEDLEQQEADVAATAQGTGVAITEPVPGYLLDACGLVNKTPEEFSEAIEEGTDVPPRVLADVEALFSGGQVAALVYNEQTTGPETEAVLSAAKAAGTAVVPVTETLPEGKDYLTWMGDNIAAVRAAVAG